MPAGQAPSTYFAMPYNHIPIQHNIVQQPPHLPDLDTFTFATDRSRIVCFVCENFGGYLFSGYLGRWLSQTNHPSHSVCIAVRFTPSSKRGTHDQNFSTHASGMRCCRTGLIVCNHWWESMNRWWNKSRLLSLYNLPWNCINVFLTA